MGSGEHQQKNHYTYNTRLEKEFISQYFFHRFSFLARKYPGN
jgi:hypothetical protein